MLELPRIQPRYSSYQRPRRSLDVGINSIGADRFVADLIVVELYLERFLYIADCASRPDVEVARPHLYEHQIVRRNELLHRLCFLGGWRKAGGNVTLFQPVMVVGGSPVVERLG